LFLQANFPGFLALRSFIPILDKIREKRLEKGLKYPENGLYKILDFCYTMSRSKGKGFQNEAER